MLLPTRRAGWLVTGASAVVAVVAVLAAAVLDPGGLRTGVLVAAAVAAFALAGWRAVRARRDRTAVHGARPISSWIAAFSWGTAVFTAIVALAAPTSGSRAPVAGVLAGCLLVLVGRSAERASAGREADPPDGTDSSRRRS